MCCRDSWPHLSKITEIYDDSINQTQMMRFAIDQAESFKDTSGYRAIRPLP